MNFLNGLGTAFGGLSGEATSTAEWGKSFANKYATWILTIILIFVLGKAFSAKVKV